MPGAHTYLQYTLTLQNFTLNHGPGSMDSAGKRAKSQKPAHGPPLQARVVAANRTVRTTCGYDDPGAHGNDRWGQSKMNGAN